MYFYSINAKLKNISPQSYFLQFYTASDNAQDLFGGKNGEKGRKMGVILMQGRE